MDDERHFVLFTLHGDRFQEVGIRPWRVHSLVFTSFEEAWTFKEEFLKQELVAGAIVTTEQVL